MQDKKVINIGCGEWGFRHLPMREHFEIARDFNFKWLEFGIGAVSYTHLTLPTNREV